MALTNWENNKIAKYEFEQEGIIISEKVLNHITPGDRWYIWKHINSNNPKFRQNVLDKLNNAKEECEANHRIIKGDTFKEDLETYFEKQ